MDTGPAGPIGVSADARIAFICVSRSWPRMPMLAQGAVQRGLVEPGTFRVKTPGGHTEVSGHRILPL